jgi:hypothetical protein
MHTIFRRGVLLAGALMMTTLAAAAQQQSAENKLHVDSVDVAATFSLEHAQVAAAGTPDFWLKGGSADAAVTLYRGLGLAVNVTGAQAANIDKNVTLSEVAVMAGPRYMHSLPTPHRTQLFAEGLFGGLHAFDSVFPGSTGATSSTGGFSMQLGGGVLRPLKPCRPVSHSIRPPKRMRVTLPITASSQAKRHHLNNKDRHSSRPWPRARLQFFAS